MTGPEEMVQLLIATWRHFVGRMPTGTVFQGNGVAALLGHVALPFFNLCTHDSPILDHDDLRRRLSLADAHGSRSPFPWMFALCEDWAPEGWQTATVDFGLIPAMILSGMATDRLKPPRRALPELEYRRVRDQATARAIAEVNGRAYDMPQDQVESLFNVQLWTEESHGYVGYLDGRPVTSAAAFPIQGTLYVAFVATLPDVHARGYGEAVMRHSIAQGRLSTGLTRTTLHATEAGRALYEAMGYETSARFSVLASVS